MYLTPFPIGLTNVALAPSSINSAVGSYLVPSFSFNLTTFIPFHSPFYNLTFRKNKETYPSTLARVKAISELVADVNHLYPYNL